MHPVRGGAGGSDTRSVGFIDSDSNGRLEDEAEDGDMSQSSELADESEASSRASSSSSSHDEGRTLYDPNATATHHYLGGAHRSV